MKGQEKLIIIGADFAVLQFLQRPHHGIVTTSNAAVIAPVCT